MLNYRPLMPGEAVHWSAQPAPQPEKSGEEDDFEQFYGGIPVDMGEVPNQLGDDQFRALASSYREHLEMLIRQGSAVGVFSGSVCLGLAAAQQFDRPGWWYLWECQVRDPYRRHGIGSHLLHKLQDQLRLLGAKALLANVPSDVAPLQQFLARNGFTPQGMDDTEFPSLVFRKDL